MFAHWRSTLLVLLLWALLFLPGLFAPEFKGEEARRAIIAHEMIQSGDWAQPRQAGEKYDRKPPLFNWLIASFWLAGGSESEGLARLPSALAILTLALVALTLMRSLLDNQAGLLAALVTLINPGSWEKGRMAEIEALYTGLFGIALMLWFWGSRRRVAQRIPAWLGAGVCLGLGILTKGPIPLLWFFLAYGLYFAIAEKKWQQLLRCEWLLILVPAALVAAPWFLWSAQQGQLEQNSPTSALSSKGASDPSVAEQSPSALAVWRSELMERVMPKEGWDPLNPLKVFAEGLLNWMPWPLLLLVLLIPKWRKSLNLDPRRMKFLRNWLWATLIAYLPIALAPNGNGRYTMPLTVAVAVFVAVLLSDPQLWTSLKKLRHGWSWGLKGLRWMVAFALLAILLVSLSWYPEQSITWRLLWWLLGLGVLALAWQFVNRLRDSVRWTPWVTSTALLLGALVCGYGFSLETFARGNEHRRKMALEVDAARTQEAEIWLYRFNFKGGRDGWIHYLEGKRRYLPERKFDAELLGEGPIEIITSSKRWEKDEDDLEKRLGKAVRVSQLRSEDPADKRSWVLALYQAPEFVQEEQSWTEQLREVQQQAWDNTNSAQ